MTSDQPESTPDEHPNDVAIPVTVVAPNADMSATFENVPRRRSWWARRRSLTLRVVNNGASTVQAATATVEVPAGWTIGSVTTTGCTVDGQSWSRALGGIGAGVSNVRTVFVRSRPPSRRRSAVFRATVGSELPDPGPAPNEATAEIDALAVEVDLGLSSQSPEVLPGDGPEVYQLRVTNHGPATATGIQLNGTFPDSVTLQAVGDIGLFDCTIDGQSFSCQYLATLSPGESDDVFMTLRHNDLSAR